MLSTNLCYQNDLTKALKTTRGEISSIVAKRNVLEALTTSVSPAADRSHNVGSKVFVYSEREKEKIGSLDVAFVEGKRKNNHSLQQKLNNKIVV